jgi:eukaryotic-like serine/threonine-protein kinase
MFCPSCGRWNRREAQRCAHCAELLPEAKDGAKSPPDADISMLRRATGGRYAVTHKLGGGGMANVYYALQMPLGRPVVVKMLHAHLAREADMRERFRREAESAAQLFHPHICPIIDFGSSGETVFLVMPFLARGTLGERMAQSRVLSPEFTAAVGAQVAVALDFAHRHGIIHRDIKPDNIMFDEDDNALVTDFGIATAHFRGRMTGTGNVMGTPHYMSPEQVRGRLLDGRSDLYTLGVVMYEVMLGFPPFDGADVYSISYKHVHEAPVAPDEVDSRVPPPLAEIIMRCLEKSPAKRYATGRELADAVLRYLRTVATSDTAGARSAWLALPLSGRAS